MQKLSVFQQRQLEHAQNLLIQSVSNHAHARYYPSSPKEIKILEKRLEHAYQSILKLSRNQAQWLANKNYSDAEKANILMLWNQRNSAETTTNKNIQTGLTHLRSRTR